MSKILYAHIWTYAPNMIDFGPSIWQISIFEFKQFYMKGKPKLHILYEYQLNASLTMDLPAQTSEFGHQFYLKTLIKSLRSQ